MPTYCWKCLNCGQRRENQVREYQVCEDCGTTMTRDWGVEKASNNFHPTVDVYANELKRRKK
jgi:hypothetical protein